MFALVKENTVVDLVEEFPSNARDYNACIDLTDYEQSPQIGWKLEGNRLVFCAVPQEKQLVNTNFRIKNIVEKTFKHLPIEKINFRDHLLPNLCLDKNVTYYKNGRPKKAEYTLDGVEYCEISFDFTDNEYGLMSSRTEKLCYYLEDDTLGEEFIISHQNYSLDNPYHYTEMITERYQAKRRILDEIKGFMNGVLFQVYSAQGWNELQIITLGADFWKAYAIVFDSWLNVGSPDLYNAFVSDTQFEFMEIPLDENGTTVRMYLIDRISY